MTTPRPFEFVLSRQDYNRHFIFAGYGDEATPEELFDLLSESYPRDTPGVIAELTSRGLQTDANNITHLIRSGQIDTPTRAGARKWSWTAKEIDQLARVLERDHRYTPAGWHRYHKNIHPGAELRAQERATFEHNAYLLDALVEIVIPLSHTPAPGDGYIVQPYASVLYLPPDQLNACLAHLNAS